MWSKNAGRGMYTHKKAISIQTKTNTATYSSIINSCLQNRISHYAIKTAILNTHTHC